MSVLLPRFQKNLSWKLQRLQWGRSLRESNRVLGRAEQFHGPKLSPADAYAKMRTTPDLAIDLLLSEPLVAQPTHFSFDTRGRLWITQYRQYPYPAGVNMISRDKYYRSHYDRVPPAPPHHDRGADIVSIHESTKHDGVYDKHTVFQDGLNMANSAVRANGGVWVMNPPYLLFYPDANGDDVPDGPPEVRLAGFGFEDTHAVANGLAWGPDGWLYGCHGVFTKSLVGKPGTPAGGETPGSAVDARPAAAAAARGAGCAGWCPPYTCGTPAGARRKREALPPGPDRAAGW